MSTKPTPIEIPHNLLESIYREARSAFPSECCGWLTGSADSEGVSEIRPCVNAQTSGAHPTSPNRSAETAYVFSADDLLTFNRSFDSNAPARIIYHSHPNGRAYFSDTDRTVATSPWGDGPAYPVQQLVVGIDGGQVVESALFTWSDDDQGFVEIARYEGAVI